MTRNMAFVLSMLLVFTTFVPQTTSIVADSFTLTAKGGCGYVDLSWSAVQGADTYWIYRGPEPGKEHSTPLTDFPIRATSYRDEINIENGKQYCYYVTAVDKLANQFGRSNEACATTRCATVRTCKLVLKYQADSAYYQVNENEKGPMETPPAIINSRLFLVIKYVTGELKGTSLEWLATERKVTINTPNGKRIELWIDKKDAKVNGKLVQIDPNNPKVVPVIRDDRSLMPMRFIAENLGATGNDGIKWFEETKTVQLTIADPICSLDGFRYPSVNQVQGDLFEFSVEYHSSSSQMPNVVLDLARKGATGSIRLGRSKENNIVMGDFKSVEVPKPTIHEIPSDKGKAQLFIWEVKLEPGLLHFYRFIANKEILPEKGYLGPVVAPLPLALSLDTLDRSKLIVGEKPTIQGFFTREPYPMIINEFWKIFEQAPRKPGKGMFVRLPQGQKIAEGSYISVESTVEKSGEVTLLNISKIVYREDISIVNNKNVVAADIGKLVPHYSPSKYAIIFHGKRNDVEVADMYGGKHYYSRLRADIGGDAFHYYPTALELGVPKNNIKMFFGSGDSEIDLICADDGDGNPFNFAWDDAEYRHTQEHDAQLWWRAGDGWGVRPATTAELDAGFAEIVDSITHLPASQDVEIYILITSHGGRYEDANEADGFGGGISAYSGYGISDDHLVAKINECFTAAGTTRGFKVRSLHQFCESGEFVDDYNNEFRWDGEDTFQLATAARYDESSWGQWPPSEDTVSYAEAGSTFSIPFINRIRQIISWGNPPTWEGNPPWKNAYNYAITVDPYAVAGTSHPMYWHSASRYLFHAGAAYINEDLRRGIVRIPIPTPVPLPEPDPVMDQKTQSLCKIGVDTSQLEFDICRCGYEGKSNPTSSFNIINTGDNKLTVTSIEPMESVLKKCTTEQVLFFSSSKPCSNASEMSKFDVGPGGSATLYMCVVPNKLQAQPLDGNGYMLMDGGAPAFVYVPIKISYSTASGENTYSSFVFAYARIRVTGVNYEIRQRVQVTRADSLSKFNDIWSDDQLTQVSVSPAPPLADDGLVALPTFNGTVNMSVKTAVSQPLMDGLAVSDFMTGFRLELPLVEISGAKCEIRGYLHSFKVDNLGKSRMKNKWSIQLPSDEPKKEKAIILQFDPGIKSAEGYSAVLGKHDFKIRVVFNAANCCDKNIVRRTVTINLTIEFTQPSRL